MARRGTAATSHALALGLGLAIGVPGGAALAQQGQGQGQGQGQDRSQEVNRLLGEAFQAIRQRTPDSAMAIARCEAAIALDPNNAYAHELLGEIHQTHTGDMASALREFDYVIEHCTGQDAMTVTCRAAALRQKGTIVFTEQDDALGAIALYEQSLRTQEQAQTLYVLSSIHHRVERNEQALDYARRAVARSMLPRAQGGEEQQEASARVTKLKLAEAIALLALGRRDEAQAIVHGRTANRDSYYDLAQYYALLAAAPGLPPAEATEQKERALEFLGNALGSRDTPRARNQLREFVEQEPDFAALRSHPGYAQATEREPE